MKNPTIVFIFLLIFTCFHACKKDVSLEPSLGTLTLVFDHGDIQKVAATNDKCFFTQGTDELVLHQLWDSSFTFYNNINAGFGAINDLQLIADDTVLFCETRAGLRYFTDNDIKFYSKNMFPRLTFDRSCQLIGSSTPQHASFQFPGSPAPTSVFRLDRFSYIVNCVAACNNLAYIGTEKQGVQVFKDVNKLHFAYNSNNTSLTSNNILDLTFDNGYLWVLTPNELAHVKDGIVSRIEQPNGIVNKSMFIRNGIILVNTNQGVYLPEDGVLKPHTNINQLIPHVSEVNDLCESPNGHIWIGTKKGLYCYRP